MHDLPPLVIQANALARRVGFPLTRQEAADAAVPSSCLPGVGRLLAVLAAGCHGGTIGEIGTGVGVGAAWMASAMPADCTLVTVEIDEARAGHATRLLAADDRVTVLAGDARELIPARAPFDLLFADGFAPDIVSYAALVDLLRVGGQIVMDDVTPLLGDPGEPPPQGQQRGDPGGSSPAGRRSGQEESAVAETVLGADDVKRDFFFGDPRLVSTEIVLPDLRNSLLIGTRLA